MFKPKNLISLLLVLGAFNLQAQQNTEQEELTLNENCVINILNRTVAAGENGEFSLPNVPSTMGLIRARATCVENGKTISGETDYFAVVENGSVDVGGFLLEGRGDPKEILLNGVSNPINSFSIGESIQINAQILYSNGETEAASGENGTNYTSSSPQVFTVDADGKITTQGAGDGILTIRKDGVVVILQVSVFSFGDEDGDGLPDDYETLVGLNPNDPIDALEDQDKDGLSALEEFELNTDPNVADTDGDGIDDGEEVVLGEDGFISDPTIADTDGDGLSDGVEILVGSDPSDESDTNFAAALVSITSSPVNVVMTFNGIDSEVTTQLSIFGTLIDGSELDLTNSENTTYESEDLSIVSFGSKAGQLFGGAPGDAVVTVSNNGKSVDINVSVRQFEALALSSVSIPGYANNVDISGDYAFIAAGSEGLQVVDVSDRVQPVVVGALDTTGTAIDIKVVGDLAYIADGESGLQILNVSNPLEPTFVANIDTAGIAQDLTVQLDTVFVANGASGIEIINVSNPANPLSISTLSGFGTVTGIDVEEDLVVITAGKALVMIDVTDLSSPMRLGSVNIGSVKDVVIENGFAHVASFSQGYRVVDVRQPMTPTITGGDNVIAPRDVALTRNFAFYAEQLFPNVVAFINIFDPQQPVFSGTINLSPFGDYAGTGIALDASYAYITEERFIVRGDFGTSGDTRLFIAQYRDINDNNGVAPTVNITNPVNEQVLVEGKRVVVTADANDDVAVASVIFSVDGTPAFTDTSAPYSFGLTIPSQEQVNVVATAVDLGGNTTASETVTIQIQPDADADGLGDTEEVDVYGTDPNDSDSDNDGLLDGDEIAVGSSPLVVDTDGDGFTDKEEVDAETDPTNPDTTPPVVISADPADLELDVPENKAITLVFDEALRAKTVNASTVRLLVDSDGTFQVAAAVRLSANNTQITITPNELLFDFTNHRIEIVGVRDIAGNLIVDYESSFVTGNFVDTVRPSVVDSNPVTNATNVPVNTLPSFVFSEAIDPDSVDSDNFFLYDTVLNQRVEGAFELSEDRASITFLPNTQLLVGRRYYLRANSTIADLFGNTLSTTIRYFTTGVEADSTGPLIENSTIQTGMTDVPTNVVINVAFNEAINPLSSNQVRLLDANGEPVFVTRSLLTNRKVLKLVPRDPLQANADYQLQIDGVEDMGGNLIAVGEFRQFQTSAGTDTARGNLLNRSIASNSTNVPLNAKFIANFSERIDPTTVQLGTNSLRIYDTVSRRNVAARFELSEDRQSIELIPEEALKPNRTYDWYAGYSPYIYDLSGNIVALNQLYSRFTTGDSEDVTEPALLVSNIADGSTNIPLNATVRFTLSEPIAGNCAASITLNDGNEDVTVSVSLSSDRRAITLTPSENLASNTTYSVNLADVCDYAGNTAEGALFNFTTGDSIDSGGPSLVSRSPENNEIDVSVNTPVVLTFDEQIAADSRINVYYDSTGTTVPGNIVVSGDTLTFTPSVSLLGGSRYRVEIRYLVNDFVGLNRRWNGDYYFTTEALVDDVAPSVMMLSPAADSVDVDPGRNIVITFSEAMNPGTLNNSNIALYVDGGVIRPSVFSSSDGRQVTLSVTKPSASLISVVMTEGITDLSGNALAPYISTYTTGVLDTDNGRPSISRQFPANGSGNWLDLDEVLLYTNEPMDPSSITQALNVAENGVLITDQGQVEVLGDNRTIRFTKDSAFTEGARVEVFLSSSATDDSGNSLNNYSAYFNMGTQSDGVGSRPVPVAYSPLTNQTGVALNPVIMIQYSEPLDEAALSGALIDLQEDVSNAQVPFTISLDDSKRVLQLTPDVALTANTVYEVILDNIVDDDGDINTSRYTPEFTTGEEAVTDDRQPTVVALSPSSGQDNVGINAMYAVRYDERMNPITFDYGEGSERRLNALFSENNQVVRYERLGTLPEMSEVTEVSPLMSDLSNNAALTRSTTFETGVGPDIVAPSRLDISIVSGSTNVQTNPVIESVFNEPIDPVSLTGAIRLYDTVDRVNVPVTSTLSEDGLRLTMVPNNTLAVGRLYYVYKYNLRDLSGNRASNFFTTFTTGLADDTTGPEYVASTIVDNSVDVPTNIRINVVYSESLAALNKGEVRLLDSLGEVVPSNISLNANRTTINVVPKALLTGLSNYTLEISGIRDLSANALITDTSLNFTTGISADFTRGNLLNRSIASNSTNVPLNAKFIANFSERIDPTTVQLGTNSLRIYDTVSRRNVAARFELSEDRQSIELIPEEALKPNRTYDWYAGYSPYIYDLSGNIVALNQLYSRFTTGDSEDVTEPALLVSNIADGSTNIPLNATVRFTLSEPIAGNCAASITLNDGNEDVTVSVSLSSDRRAITLTPSENLASNTTYSVNLADVCDYAGNTAEGALFNFTTGDSIDSGGPSLVSRSPENNEIDVSVNTPVVLTFDEQIAADSRINVYYDSTGTTVPGNIVVSGDTLTFTPSVSLLGGSRYRVEIRYLVNDFVGLNRRWNGDYYFTTEALVDDVAPSVMMLSPAADSVDVDPGRNIVITFSEAMNPGTLNNSNIALYVDGGVIRPSVFSSSDGRQVTLSVTKPSASLISVVMTEGITDLSGNALAPYISTYTTGVLDTDNGRPSISRQFPANGSGNWLDLDEVLLYTNEPMDPSSITQALNVAENGVLITDQGQVEVLGDNRTIRFTKDSAFTEGARVEVFLSSSATDDSGNSLNNYSAYFNMGTQSDGVGSRPVPVAYSPLTNQTGVALNPVIMIQYSEPLDEAALSGALIDLQEDVSNAQVPFTISLDDSKRVLQLTPDVALTANTVYEVILDNIVDDDGDINTSRYTPEFTTGEEAVTDDRQPTVVALSPSSGQDNVGINAMYAVRYDERMNPITFDYGEGSERRLNALFSENNQVVRYERLGTLPEMSEVTEVSPLMSDLSNNAALTRSTTFETGVGPDIVAPSRLDISIVSGSTNVQTNPVIESVFNEPIDPVSLTGAIRLYDTVDRVNVPVTSTLSEDGLRLTMVPNNNLDENRYYYVYKYDLRDLSGNRASNFFTTFTTGAELDAEKPTLVGSTISNEAVGVPLNLRLRMRFSEPLNSLSVNNVTLEDALGNAVPSLLSFEAGRTTLLLLPKQLLSANTSYVLTINGVRDLSGNEIDEVTINFTTAASADFARGNLVSRSVINGATDVARNAKFIARVSERIDPTTVQLGTNSLRIYDTVDRVSIQASLSISSDGKTIEIVPNELLSSNRVYDWYMGYSPYIYDLAGNYVALNQLYSRFTTGIRIDGFGPELVSSNIPVDGTNIPVNARLELEFDEPLSADCGLEFVLSDGSSNVDFVASLSSNQKTVTLLPDGDLAPSTDYSVASNGICDYSGNASAETLRSFSTANTDVADTAGPSLLDASPANNAVDVDISTAIVLTFNEQIAANSRIVLHGSSGAISGTQTIIGNQLTFVPDEDLQSNYRHRIEIRYLVNDFVGTLNWNGDIYFTTAASI